jgi:hypothetical protein
MVKRCFRAAALALIATMLVASAPRPAKAVDSTTWIIVGGVIGGLVVAGIIGTIIVYSNDDELVKGLVASSTPPADGRQLGLRFGPACAPSAVDGQAPLLCW